MYEPRWAPAAAVDEEAELCSLRQKLERDFRALLPLPLIDLVWQEEEDRLLTAPEQQFLPLVVEHAARDRLRGLSGAPGSRR